MTLQGFMNKQKMRVWWIPQVGAVDTPFYIPVESVVEAKKILDTLAFYDCYQFNKRVKGDYCNTGGLQTWDEEEQDWVDWEYITDDDYFDDVDEYIESKHPEIKGFTNALANQVSFDY